MADDLVHFDASGMTAEEQESVAAYEEMIGLRRSALEREAAWDRIARMEAADAHHR